MASLAKMHFEQLFSEHVSISELEFYKFLTEVEGELTKENFDMLLYAFSEFYNRDNVSRAWTVSKKIAEFSLDVARLFLPELKEMIKLLMGNGDQFIAYQFVMLAKEIDATWTYRQLEKNAKDLQSDLRPVLTQLEYEYEQFEELTVEIEGNIELSVKSLNVPMKRIDYFSLI